MGSTQNFDEDFVEKVKAARESLEEGFKGIVPAFNASIDLAHSHEIPVLERESSAGLESAQTITKLQQELDESLGSLIKYYEEMANAMA